MLHFPHVARKERMRMENKANQLPSQISPQKPPPLFTPDNTVAIYTVLSIMMKMKNNLGMEAMLEYVAKYLSIIERNNPHFKDAVKDALDLLSVEKLYKDAMGK